MKTGIAYISYDNNDRALWSRSKEILFDFIGEDYCLDENSSDILFVASGGSEKYAIELTDNKQNIILLCHKESNSFAAAMEIASYLRERGKRVAIIDVFAIDSKKKFDNTRKIFNAISNLINQKAAVIGEVSEWLINSDANASNVKDRFGIDLIRIPWDNIDDYRQLDPSPEFMDYFPETDTALLEETSKVYRLLDSVIDSNHLQAISVECFSMVKRDKVTACLPLSVLNTQKKVAACEGDVCSMIGDMVLKEVIGIVPWQANVAEIKDREVLFAHCTAPLNLLESSTINTHFETNCGTAIEGKFRKGKVAAFRLNSKMDSYMLIEGQVLATPSYPTACRTQIVFRTDEYQTSLLKNKGLGNHHLIFPSEFAHLIIDMMQYLGIERVE